MQPMIFSSFLCDCEGHCCIVKSSLMAVQLFLGSQINNKDLAVTFLTCLVQLTYKLVDSFTSAARLTHLLEETHFIMCSMAGH